MLWISCLLTASLFLLLLPCFPGQTGGENEQSTDIISVWEGDSISITCLIEGSENEVGTWLTTRIQPMNVIYVSKANISILPALANRVKYSKEGRNLRITLHNVQASDSNIYLCTTYIKIKEHHKKLSGKTTIVIVKAKTSGVVEQSPFYVSPQQGQSINITCALESSHEDEGILLLKTHVQPERVLYVSSQNASTISPTFANRLEYSKEDKKIVVTLHNLQKNDSDLYVCTGILKNSLFSVNGSGTMILIKALFSTAVCFVLQMKNYFKKKIPNVVYEDMSYSSRRNTVVRTNAYSIDN
ncbi:CD7 protein, partial [Podilymbus podiceps]|nr:CD7 protein [Podilymbus podiceps]